MTETAAKLTELVRSDGLSVEDWTQVERMLGHPAAWAFAVLAGRCGGLDQAVGACRTRSLTAAQQAALAAGQWTADDLPTHADILNWLIGCRVAADRAVAARRRLDPTPLRDLAAQWGVTVPILRAADTAFRALGLCCLPRAVRHG